MAAGIGVPRRIVALVGLALCFAVACAQMLGEVEIAGQETQIRQALPADAGPPPKPVICELGTTKCDDRLLQLCTDGGTAWVTWQACATAALCEASDLSTIAACIAPTCSVADDFKLRLGDAGETLTSMALGYLEDGQCPATMAGTAQISSVRAPSVLRGIEPGERQGMWAD